MNSIQIPGVDKDKVQPLKCNDEILADFDCIVDIDIGIYKYLLKNFKNSKFFNYNFNSVRDDSSLYQAALFREEINPIYGILSTKNNEKINDDDANELLKDIMSNSDAYQSVIDLSPHTDICGLMKLYVDSQSGINVTVLCRNKMEVDTIHKIDKNLRTTTEKRSKINTDLYNAYFVKYYMNILEFKNFSGNQVYIMEYKFNMDDYEKKIPFRPLSYLIKDSNIIKTVCPYNEPNLPKG